MSRDIRIQPILDDLAELKELLLVIDQTPSTPGILYKLAGEKAQALTDAIFLLHHDVKQKVSEQKDNGVKESRDVEVSVIPDLGYPEEPVIDDEEVPFVVECTPSVDEEQEEEVVEEISDDTERTLNEEQNGQNIVSKNIAERESVCQIQEPESVAVPKFTESGDIGKDVNAVDAVVDKTVFPKNVDAEISVDEALQRKRAKDIRKAMTLNGRFRFRRELFLNSDEVMNSAIDALGEIGTFADAETFLQGQFGWDPENATVIDFMSLVEKRYL